jgi:predicted aconitase with swiveling domain
MGTAPAAIITEGVDSFLTLASIVADEMYGNPIPVIAVTADDYRILETGQQIEIRSDGTCVVKP